jgi:hypothetical protein
MKTPRLLASPVIEDLQAMCHAGKQLILQRDAQQQPRMA